MIDAIHRLPLVPQVTGTEPVGGVNRAAKITPANEQNFADLLQSQIAEPLNFSAHAQSRLATRSIQLTQQQVARLENGVSQAAQKGARDSLVMMDNLAFIVSVKNRTVVTALEGAAQQGNVFTQIDSAVIV